MLLRVYSKMDGKNKITLPRGIRRELNIQSGEKLELKIAGIENAKKLIISKTKQPETYTMKSKRPISSLRGIKSIQTAGIRGIPKVLRSGYLDLYTLRREKDRLENEISGLDKRRNAAAMQLNSVVKRVVQLQKETSEEEHVKNKESIRNLHSMHAKSLKTMGIKY